MIVYNVTIKVDHSIASQWLEWLKKEHIPDVTGTGCFTHANAFHLFEADDEEGITYVVQYHASGPAEYNRYITEFADEMRKRSIERWGNKFIAFRTVMQVVN
jgi:hypothetical protein